MCPNGMKNEIFSRKNQRKAMNLGKWWKFFRRSFRGEIKKTDKPWYILTYFPKKVPYRQEIWKKPYETWWIVASFFFKKNCPKGLKKMQSSPLKTKGNSRIKIMKYFPRKLKKAHGSWSIVSYFKKDVS